MYTDATVSVSQSIGIDHSFLKLLFSCNNPFHHEGQCSNKCIRHFVHTKKVAPTSKKKNVFCPLEFYVVYESLTHSLSLSLFQSQSKWMNWFLDSFVQTPTSHNSAHPKQQKSTTRRKKYTPTIHLMLCAAERHSISNGENKGRLSIERKNIIKFKEKTKQRTNPCEMSTKLCYCFFFLHFSTLNVWICICNECCFFWVVFSSSLVCLWLWFRHCIPLFVFVRSRARQMVCICACVHCICNFM